MGEAQELQIINDRFFHWNVYDTECKCDLSSTALVLKEGLVIFDPAPLAASALETLLAKAPLRSFVITNGNHARATLAFKEKFKKGVPIVTTAVTRRELKEFKADVILLDSELLYGLAPMVIAGGSAGETAFYHKEMGLIVVGDAVLNLSSEKGLEILPDKYTDDPSKMKESLKKLLDLDFHTMAFAHGTPIVGRAKDALRAALEA